MSEQVMISFMVPIAMKERLKQYAKDTERSVSGMIRLIIWDWEFNRSCQQPSQLVDVPTQPMPKEEKT